MCLCVCVCVCVCVCECVRESAIQREGERGLPLRLDSITSSLLV